MKIRLFGRSDVGCVRDNNEDMILIGISPVRDAEISEEKEISDQDRFCVLVSDGMGGHENGEEASEHTLMRIRSAVMNRNNNWDSTEEMFEETIRSISNELNAMSTERALDKSMGCTLSGFIFLDGKIYLVNIGDSRSYRYRDGILRQLSTDQTLHERDGVELPQGKALYSCIGANCEAELSIEEISERIMEGDRFLLCTDGLTDMVREDDIEATLAKGTAEEAVGTLIEKAKTAGGRDNVSVIVLDFPAEQKQDSYQEELQRIVEIAERVIQSRDNALIPHRNIPLVQEAFEIFRSLPDYIEGELTPYLKISYLEQLIDELNEYNSPRMLIQMREYQLALFDQVDESQIDGISAEDIRESLQKLKDYIDESISMEEFCQKYSRHLKFDPVERSERWEEIIYEVSEKAIEECGEPGYMGYCFGYWQALSSILSSYGIEWKSPQRMNPRVMFD